LKRNPRLLRHVAEDSGFGGGPLQGGLRSGTARQKNEEGKKKTAKRAAWAERPQPLAGREDAGMTQS
jgi:hypothetical protein